MVQSIDRRTFLKSLSAGLAAGAGGCSLWPDETLQKTERPNVVLIYIDDMDFTEIGAYGGKVLTPNMDSLASDGCLFERAYVVSAVCSPSRYGLLTGNYSSRSNFYKQRYSSKGEPQCIGNWPGPLLQSSEKTFAHVMKNAGYTTGFVGKWHLSNPNDFIEALDSDADLNEPDVREKVDYNYKIMQKTVAKLGGFDYVESLYWHNKFHLGVPKPLQVHNMDWITKGSLDFINENKHRPFFLNINTTLPHQGIFQKWHDPKDESWKEWLLEDRRKTPKGMLENAPDVQPSGEDVIKRVEKAGLHSSTSIMTWIDDSIGAVLKKLDDAGISENTLVMLMSDHQTRGKFTPYEKGIRVPFMVKWPKVVRPSSKCGRLVGNIDISATVLEACGIDKSLEAANDGKSFLPCLLGNSKTVRNSLLVEMGYSKAVVTERWKYIAIRYPQDVKKQIEMKGRKSFDLTGRNKIKYNPKLKYSEQWKGHRAVYVKFPNYYDFDQLYDLKNDPEERVNLAAKAEYKDQLDEMKDILKKYMEKIPQKFGEFNS
ncbi:sulfatase family protein [Sedimentisphaera salicampi]|uniref:sulfatase family protein n=1 Tax=Sedimentisphaera salicampi TaxID=1941349 RepID=UPI000B9AD084|nr:sulfatase-like hydrolase/transferase [Sedimentisphaera salicampi]OXU15314.1 Arylsulfatase [Sedimentisphaera salicampi]